MQVAFEEAARIVLPTGEWFGHGFEKYPFERRALPLDEALAMRSCWVPCARFAGFATDPGWREGEALANSRDIAAFADVFDLSKSISVLACSKRLMDLVRPGRCPGDFPPEDLIAFDGNHRLAALALRRFRGLVDDATISAYVCISS